MYSIYCNVVSYASTLSYTVIQCCNALPFTCVKYSVEQQHIHCVQTLPGLPYLSIPPDHLYYNTAPRKKSNSILLQKSPRTMGGKMGGNGRKNGETIGSRKNGNQPNTSFQASYAFLLWKSQFCQSPTRLKILLVLGGKM